VWVNLFVIITVDIITIILVFKAFLHLQYNFLLIASRVFYFSSPSTLSAVFFILISLTFIIRGGAGEEYFPIVNQPQDWESLRKVWEQNFNVKGAGGGKFRYHPLPQN